MRQPSAAMHVAKIERKHDGRTYVSHLLRQSYRQDGQVKHRTLANLSHLPQRLIEVVRRSLQGEVFLSSDETVRTLASKPHGHVEAIVVRQARLDLGVLVIDVVVLRQELLAVDEQVDHVPRPHC